MKFTETELDLLEHHHLGTLTAEEKAALEARLQSDGAFRAEAALFADFFVALRANGDAALKQMLVEEEGRIRSTGPPKNEAIVKPLKGRWWAWATVAAVALLAILFLVIKNQQPRPSQLFAEHFAPYPNAMAPIERGEAPTGPAAAAFAAYTREDYPAAVIAFDEALRGQPGNTGLLFYKAVALLANGQPAQAVALLLPLAESAQSQFQQQAGWYLALGYLKNGELEKCRIWLQKIMANPSGYKHAEATALLDSLSNG